MTTLVVLLLLSVAVVPAAPVKETNPFAFELYAKFRDRDGNLFFSPHSLGNALAMTHAGARGQTADEIARILHLPQTADGVRPVAFRPMNMNPGGQRPASGGTLRSANALWGQQGLEPHPDFVRDLKTLYGAEFHEADYISAAEAARKTINAWVEKQTSHKIRELLKDGMLSSDTRLVLVNALHFKADWHHPFKKDRTRDDTFQLNATDRINVPLMSQAGKFRHAEDAQVQVLELPYAGEEWSMLVILPKKTDGLAAVEQNLTAHRLREWISNLRESHVAVTLPKFRMASDFHLKKPLMELGMTLAFTDNADLSRMGGRKGQLRLSEVVHKGCIEVNEEGPEAAAATGAIAQNRSIQMGPVFRADHPFLFLIRDLRSERILFLGRLVNPAE